MQAVKVLGVIGLIILSIFGALIGGIIGMFVGASAGPMSILDGRAGKASSILTDITNVDIDKI